MQQAATLSHPDSCSGTTVMDDGTKVYWTEGYSDAYIVHPDGRTEVVNAHTVHPILEIINEGPVTGECRNMTVEEVREYYAARGEPAMPEDELAELMKLFE